MTNLLLVSFKFSAAAFDASADAFSERSLNTQPNSHSMRTSSGSRRPNSGVFSALHGSYSPSARRFCAMISNMAGQHMAPAGCWLSITEPELLAVALSVCNATQYAVPSHATPETMWGRGIHGTRWRIQHGRGLHGRAELEKPAALPCVTVHTVS